MARKLFVPQSAESGQFVRTHGMTDTPEYQAWANAIYRCENRNSPLWQNYGGRGIRVCDEWRNSFDAFIEHLGPRPEGCSLDRIDVNKGYEPGNCRWADARLQANNRRNTPRVRGLSPAEISEKTGLPYTTIKNRLRRGWSAERILSQPRRDYPEKIAC